ncbi:pyridoxal phosphate-dependent aminotransferase [soil metagenome]
MTLDLPTRRFQSLLTAWSDFLPYHQTDWNERRKGPDACDFITGDPQDGPIPGFVEALQRAAVPQRPDWFGYLHDIPEAVEAVAASLRDWSGVPFEPEDIALTNGGFGALAASIRAATDPDDEIIVNPPLWFAYEGICVDAGVTPVKVSINRETFDLNLDAIAAAITPKTRAVLVNSPHNPTGKVYPPETLERLAHLLDEASARHGRAIYIISDEAFRQLVFNGERSYSPAEFYDRTFVCYTYGKVLLAPGERLGYVAIPPTMAEREQMRLALLAIRASSGYLVPNTTLQYALPELNRMSIDIDHLQRKRDRLIDELRAIGFEVHRPESSLFLIPKSPLEDEWAFCRLLADHHDVYTMPGSLFSLPGYFRLSLTATDEMIELAIPRFRAAFEQAQNEQSTMRLREAAVTDD